LGGGVPSKGEVAVWYHGAIVRELAALSQGKNNKETHFEACPDGTNPTKGKNQPRKKTWKKHATRGKSHCRDKRLPDGERGGGGECQNEVE